LEALRGAAPTAGLPPATGADPYGEDLQLALHLCYELHYRAVEGVDAELEWDPDLLRFRRGLEQPFLAALREQVPGGRDVDGALAPLLEAEVRGSGPSWFLRRDGERRHLREYVAHRSTYHLKEADPQSWVVPRLEGQAKASMAAVQHDEYGAGSAGRMHAVMFAALMVELGLDDSYGAYLDAVPATTLAPVNLMSLLGLHRSLRGAAVGQFAMIEVTSSPGSRRLAQACERLGVSGAFYDEHVEADAVHEQVLRVGLLRDLLAREPELSADVVLGVQAGLLLEERFGDALLTAWQHGGSSLRREA
ncbi:MAG: hypothetical protein JWN57_2423, partial [Frankiales bacterium]|nr:hypothetical protein [Frankiales bacterium]